MPDDTVSNAPAPPQQMVSNSPAASSAPSAAPSTPQPSQPQPQQQAPQVDPATRQQAAQQTQQDPSAPQANLSGGQGAPSLPDAPQAHPLVQKASLVHQIAQTLAGGPRYQTTIDPQTGVRTQKQVPMSGRDIGMALAMEAISGAMTGLATPAGPNAAGRAAAAGFAQGQAQRSQEAAQQQQQAEDDVQQKAGALSRAGSVFQANMQGLHNTAEAEKLGADSIDSLIDQNRKAGLLDTDNSFVDNNGEQMTQAQLMDAMKNGSVSTTDHLGPVAGRIEVTDTVPGPDGKPMQIKRWEATHLLLKSGDEKVNLTQADADRYGALGIDGYKSGMKIPDGFQIPLRMQYGLAQEAGARVLANNRLGVLHNILDGTPQGKLIPSKIDYSQPGMGAAMRRFQNYTSHNADNGNDPYLALQQMGADKRDKDGQLQPNPDAKYVDSVAQAFGGWDVIKAAHDKVVADADFAKKSADNQADVDKQKALIPVDAAKARAVASATVGPRAAAAGAEESARLNAKQSFDDAHNPAQTTPDALGFQPNVPGGLKEANKRQASFKKQADDLARTEQTYSQFQSVAKDIAAGNYSGAESVVALFDSIGISATPLAGKGFRINESTVKEHEQARGWLGSLQAQLGHTRSGQVITPEQVQSYARIASQARAAQYTAVVNQAHNAGLGADFALPTGNGQKIDADTAKIFMQLSGGDPAKARAAAQKKGWGM